MKKIMLLGVATLLLSLLSVTEMHAQEAVKSDVTTLMKLKEKKSCCSKKEGKKVCKEKDMKNETVAENKTCSKKSKGDKKCCKPTAKKEEETTPAAE